MPADGVRALLSGHAAGAVAGRRATRASSSSPRLGSSAIRAKGIALTELAITLVDERLAELGVARGLTARRRAPGRARRARPPGCAGAVRPADRRGVIADFRAPDVIRLGLSPLTTRFVDVWDAVDAVRGLLAGSADA